jgi:hypothetical protein
MEEMLTHRWKKNTEVDIIKMSYEDVKSILEYAPVMKFQVP